MEDQDFLDQLANTRQLMHEDFPYYAEKCLLIRSKADGVIPFKLNKAQLYVHEKLEEQKSLTGYVRAILLKGRQSGATTYVQGRYLEKLTYEKGKNCFVMTHEDKSTKEIFLMTKRYYENIPEYFKPVSTKNNVRELAFDDLDSKYSVGTAGSGNSGRGFTIQYFHGSEVGFWTKGDELTAGIMNAVPDAPGTEIIFESTANGVNNIFKQYWDNAVSGENGFLPIFISWTLQDEYRKTLPQDFKLTEDEKELKELYNLDDEQIYWRRLKISQSSEDQFKQEYPLNPQEAFLDVTVDSFIKTMDVEKARLSKEEFKINKSPLLMGVDVARGGDRSVLVLRRGREVTKIASFQNDTTTEIVGYVKQWIKEYKPDKVFIDATGMGWAVVDPLRADGYDVTSVVSAESADEKDKYRNKRAEMWGRMREWFSDRPNKIIDDEGLVADILAVAQKAPDASGRIQIENKDEIFKKIKRSPDKADALALTFAYPVNSLMFNVNNNEAWDKIRNRESMYDW